MARAKRIRITIKGTPGERGHILLPDLVRQLDALRAALKSTAELLGGDAIVKWRVVDLSHNSPVSCVLEEIVVRRDDGLAPPPRVSTTMAAVLQGINKTGAVAPEYRDLAALESYRDLAVQAGRATDGVTLSVGRTKIALGDRFRERLEKVIGADEVIKGSVVGRLDAINLHGGNAFVIYPIAGAKRVTCKFDDSLKAKVLAGLERWVEVHGDLHYKSWAPFPHAVKAEEILTLPELTDSPTLASLRGIAPDATGELSAADFVRGVRDEW